MIACADISFKKTIIIFSLKLGDVCIINVVFLREGGCMPLLIIENHCNPIFLLRGRCDVKSRRSFKIVPPQ